MHEGRVLAGKYRLLDKLTAGGMGSVWRAEHVELGSPAAVKLLEATIADSPEALARFKREARSSASLRSTNIVQVFDFGVDGQTPYIAMELLRGKSLAERLREERVLTPQETASVLAQVARAAAWAHSRGIVHRDLKPGNIFLSEDANDIVVKLLDFGIAKPLRLDLTATPVTLAGAIMGTPQYMSPEQAAGKKDVDHRTDIWSFAVIAFECLTGRHAFRADTLGGLVLAICTEPLPIPSQHGTVPAGFDAWFARAAHREPDQRYSTIAEAGEALMSVCGVDSAISSRTAYYISAARAEAAPPASHAQQTSRTGPLDGNPTDDAPPDTATTKKTFTHPVVGGRFTKPLIFLGLFGTGAAAAMLAHFSSSHSQPVPSTPGIASVTATNRADVLGIARPEPQPAASSAYAPQTKPPPASATPIENRPNRPTRSAWPARANEVRPLSPGQSPAAPLASQAVSDAAPSPSQVTNCDPKVKNELGICPRPGK